MSRAWNPRMRPSKRPGNTDLSIAGQYQRRRAADPLKHAHTDKHFGLIRQRTTQ